MELTHRDDQMTPAKSVADLDKGKSRIPLSTKMTPPFRRSISNLSRTQIGPIYEYQTSNSFDDSMQKSSNFGSKDGNLFCDHSSVACNGTTFSGKKMKYLIHCPNMNTDNGHYLTPTQRAQKEIRVLKQMLISARKDLQNKDDDIIRLTNEIIQLRLQCNSQTSPDDPSNSSDLVTVCENTDNLNTIKNNNNEMSHENLMVHSSYSDSGHYDDFTNSSISSKFSSISLQMHDKSTFVNFEQDDRDQLIDMYEKKLDNLMQLHNTEKQELRQKYHEKIEELLLKLTDVNTRYSDLVPDYNSAQDHIRNLEKQLEELSSQLDVKNKNSNSLGTEMYHKGLQIGRMESYEKILSMKENGGNVEPVKLTALLDQLEKTHEELENLQTSMPDLTKVQSTHSKSSLLLSTKNAISLWVLGARKVAYNRLTELQKPVNKVDPEITLKFLKSAIYYYLTDENNYDGHLKAIENILGFTEAEKLNIKKCRNLS